MKLYRSQTAIEGIDVRINKKHLLKSVVRFIQIKEIAA